LRKGFALTIEALLAFSILATAITLTATSGPDYYLDVVLTANDAANVLTEKYGDGVLEDWTNIEADVDAMSRATGYCMIVNAREKKHGQECGGLIVTTSRKMLDSQGFYVLEVSVGTKDNPIGVPEATTNS